MGMSPYLEGMRDRIGHDLIMLAGTCAVIRDAEGRVLLQRRGDNNMWSLPGGAVDPGEAPATACAREVLEETGLIAEPVAILAVIGGEDMRFSYPNGDVVEVVCTAFECRVTGGALFADGAETLELRYFDPADLPPIFPAATRPLATGEMAGGWFRRAGC